MGWKVTKHKISNQQQELNVAIMVNELALYTVATYAEFLISQFEEQLEKIPRRNNYSADHFYKATQRNLKSIEVWKTDINGDFKYKMMTLDYDENIDPFKI